MKLAIPSPTYPAVTEPFGPSILTNFSYGLKVNWTVGVAPENEGIKKIIEHSAESKLLEVVNLNFMYFEDGAALETWELEHAVLNYGLVFNQWEDQLNYTIRAKGVPKAKDLTNDGLPCHLTDDQIEQNQNIGFKGIVPCAPTNYYYQGFLNLQSAIEYSWINVSFVKPFQQ